MFTTGSGVIWERRLLAGMLMTCAVLAGCAGNTGPFGSGGGLGQECIPLHPGGVLSYGFEEFRNTGGTATVTRVDLAGPHGLRLLAAYAVPITGHDLYGILRGYPPAGYLPRRECSGRGGRTPTARSSRTRRAAK